MYFYVVNVVQFVCFSSFLGKCLIGWYYYEGMVSCYRVYLSGENYWDVVQICQCLNGFFVIFFIDQELCFVLVQEWDQLEWSFGWKDQCKLWVGYQYVIIGWNCFLEGCWEVVFKGFLEVFLFLDFIFVLVVFENDNVFCVQFQCFYFFILWYYDFYSWYVESCYEKFLFLCKRS